MHGEDVQGIGPARLLNAAAVGLAWVTVSKSSTLKVTVFDVEPLFGSTFVAERLVAGVQYQLVVATNIRQIVNLREEEAVRTAVNKAGGQGLTSEVGDEVIG